MPHHKIARFLPLILGLIIVPTFAFAAIMMVNNFSSIDIFQSQMQPTSISSISFDVKNQQGDLLGSINGQSNVLYYTDPLHRYPSVDIFYSQPWYCDNLGNPSSIPLVVTDKLVLPNDTVLFMQKVRQSMNWGVRIYPNLPPYKDTTTSLSPFDGYLWSYYGGGWVKFSTTPNPADWNGEKQCRGSLAGWIGCGTNPWDVKLEGSAAITASLEQIDFPLEACNPAARAGHTLNDAYAALQNNYGNRMVIVQPHVDIAALTNQLRYTYKIPVTFSNGSTGYIGMNMNSASIGFTDAYRTGPVNGYVGLIPDSQPDLFKNVSMQVDQKDAMAEKNAHSDTKAEFYSQKLTIRGWVTYQGDEPDKVLTRAAEVHNTFTSLNGRTITVNLDDPGNNYGMDSRLTARTEMVVQPETTIHTARTQVGYTLWAEDHLWPTEIDASLISNSKVILYPYAIKEKMVYAMSTLTWECTIITSNDAAVYTSTGQEIDPSQLVNFDLNSIINDASQDDVLVEIESTSTNWLNIIITIVVIIIVVVVIWFVMSLRKGSGGGSHGGIHGFINIIKRGRK